MIRIYTFSHKRPDFIELQLSSFYRHLKEPFSFTVFNNAAFDIDRTNYDQIASECTRLGIERINIERDPKVSGPYESLYGIHSVFTPSGKYANANVACAYPLAWAWRAVISKAPGPVCIMDSDMFLMEPITLSDYLKEHPMVIVPQSRPNGVYYAWNGLVMADIPKLPEPETVNWWCGQVSGEGVDVGGLTHHYFKAHPEVTLKTVGPEHHHDIPGQEHEIIRLDGKGILHYGAGSNWNKRSVEYHAKKTAWLKERLA